MRRLRELREEKGISQAKFAEEFSIAQQTISSYENGSREPDTTLLKKFADYFNVTVDYLIGNTNEKNVYRMDKNNMPLELREVGLEYIYLAKEMQDKEIPPEDIKKIIDVIKNNK